MGASRTWVIPSVVGTVEDIVDDLKGGSRVGLIDFVQVRPGGDGESRRGHWGEQSTSIRDCSNVRNSLLYG